MNQREGNVGGMDRVCSVEDIADSYWTENPSGLNRNSSELLLQRFYQEDSPAASSSSPHTDAFFTSSVGVRANGGVGGAAANGTYEREKPAAGAPGVSPPMDTLLYQAILKQRLDLACAAVSLARASGVKSHESSLAVNGHQDSEEPEFCSQSSAKGPSRSQDNGVVGPVGIPSLPLLQKNQIPQVKVTRSGSSREQSDDDELEEETEVNEKMDLGDAKRMRRMISNRESARRSRRRKQAHLGELEKQVSQLRVENSSLQKRLTGISQKSNEAAVDNRILKADVETLRTKVKMAEETMKRVTGVGSGPLFQTMLDMSSANMQFSGSPSDNTADPVMPVQDESKHFYQPVHVQGLNNGVSDINNGWENLHGLIGKTESAASLLRVASLEHLQKRIHGGPSAGPLVPQNGGWSPENTNLVNDSGKPSKTYAV